MSAALDIDRARTALWALDAGVDRREWVRIGCAAKAAGLAFEDFNDWSATAGNYGGQRDASDAWKSFKQNAAVNAGTLFHLARQAGWSDPANDNRPEPGVKRSAPVSEWWGNAAPASADHPYIIRKHGSPDGLRVVRGTMKGWGKHPDADLDGWLAVPVRSADGSLASIQFIAPDGRKLNAWGCPMAGTFTVGALVAGASVYVVEGIGHAWSLNAATGHPSIVSFGAGNISRAVAMAKGAGALPVIVPDRGKEAEGEAAAARHACGYAPLPADLPDGADVNDLHLERGADAVRAVVASPVMPQAANDNTGSAARDEARRRRQREENDRLQELPFSILPPSMTVDDMQDDCVWIATGSQVGCFSNPRQVLSFKEFADLTASSATEVVDPEGKAKPRRVPNAAIWKNSADRITVYTRTFHAGADVICADPEGMPALNSWRPIERGPATHDVAPFVEQVGYLFADQVERAAFLDWLSHIEQRPGVLPHYGWLHIAANTGTGRNWLASVLARLWRGYVAPNVDLPALLESQFNGQLAGRVLAIVDEVQEGGGENPYRHVNKLKSLVNAEFRDINPKFGRQYREHNACRWLVFSNHENALPLNDTDRRWRVVRHDAAPRSPADYAALYALLDDAEFVNAVGAYLRERNITGFNPGERPPMNDAKRAAVAASKSLVQQYAEDLVARWPSDVVANSDAAQVLSDGALTNLTPAMRRALEELGAVALSKTMYIQGRTSRGWVLRDAERWANASSAEVASEAARARGYESATPAMEVLNASSEDTDRPF